MSKTLGPVALKLGDEVLVKVRTNTAIKDLLEQLDKACKGGRIQDADGFDVTAHYSQDLPEGEYAIKQPTAELYIDDIKATADRTGQADLQAKVDFMHDAIKRCEARDQTVKVAISSATDAKRKLVEGVCGVQFVHSLPPVFHRAKRHHIQQQLLPPASINKFVWTGDDDNSEEIERLTLRLKALIGWDDFPSDLELRDVHTQTLFDARLEDESHRVEITGKSDIALQHSKIEPGGFILENIFLLVEAKKDLSLAALKAAEAKAYMQYVAFVSATHRYVPVLLTDGNTMILYAHSNKRSAHQRLYWDFGQILEASIYLEELVKQIALTNPLMRAYIPGQDDPPEPQEEPGREHGGTPTDAADLGVDDDESEHDDKEFPTTSAEEHHGTSRTAGSRSLAQRHCLTEMQDADMQEALRLARYHPCVTAVYGLPSYAKPSSYGLAS